MVVCLACGAGNWPRPQAAPASAPARAAPWQLAADDAARSGDPVERLLAAGDADFNSWLRTQSLSA
jgi:hypothetical protein